MLECLQIRNVPQLIMNTEAIEALIAKNPKLAAARGKLEAMQVGRYCLHRSWGFGKIVDYDAVAGRLIINFEEGKEGQAMAPAFCVDKLEVLDDKDVLVRSRTESELIAEMIKKQPVDFMCEMLAASNSQAMSVAEIERALARVMGPVKYKKWWTATKKLLVKDPRVGVPIKKTDPYILREKPVAPEEEILEQFHATKNSKHKIQLGEQLYALSENISVVRDEMPKILEELTEAIAHAKVLSQADRLHGVWVRNNLARDLHEDVELLEPSSASILDATNDYSELAEQLPPTYYKRYLDLIRRTYPEKWGLMLEDLLRNSSGKFTSECINFMLEQDLEERVTYCINRWLNEQTIKGPLLYWLVKNRASKKYQSIIEPMVSARLLAAMFYAIDYESLQNASARRIPLADLLSDDAQLIPDLLADASLETARDLAQTLLLNQGFENLTKKSLLARFIRIHPTIQSLLAGESSGGKEDEGLIVSQASFDKAKQEYEELIAVKIPENKEAIATAREHGDLKENSEYKMARQDQDILLSRKNELEVDLSRARVTDFSEAESDSVGIGSVVELKEGSSGQTVRYAILGAWDSDPDKNVLSYKTPLAQKLLNAGLGASVQTNIGGNEEVWEVLSIARWIDQAS